MDMDKFVLNNYRNVVEVKARETFRNVTRQNSVEKICSTCGSIVPRDFQLSQFLVAQAERCIVSYTTHPS